VGLSIWRRFAHLSVTRYPPKPEPPSSTAAMPDTYYSSVATAQDKTTAIEKMDVLTNDSSTYSAFIKWCILEDEELSKLLDVSLI
jgi:hypothetical protein